MYREPSLGPEGPVDPEGVPPPILLQSLSSVVDCTQRPNPDSNPSEYGKAATVELQVAEQPPETSKYIGAEPLGLAKSPSS